ncbi:MAG: outer membrane beta-barrel family protein [Tenuifilaceae bacterium]|nr:outer membrane beta-barrel family protein [Tenuifilaceae bacterium]
MKTTNRILRLAAASIFLILIEVNKLAAQELISITGNVVELSTNEPIPFANVGLYNSEGTTLITGAGCGLNGDYTVKTTGNGIYRLTLSAIGYHSITKEVDLTNKSNINLGTTYLAEHTIGLEDITIVGNRVRAKNESDKNTFFISNEMQQAASTGADIIKFIPGIQVDFMRNISLDGNRNILILVDGRERDAGFLNQLNARNIMHIEVSNTPPARYEGKYSGVINIVLVKEKSRGLDGHLFAEIPTSESMVYIFPSYSLNYGVGRFNLFTSYNGEVSKLNLHNSTQRQLFNQLETDHKSFESNQYVLQDNWSHRFNYGLDYLINNRNQINFYAFHNIFSQEYDGQVDLTALNCTWRASKKDYDRNRNNFYSLFYKHSFNDSTNHEITFDISLQHFEATSSTQYSNIENFTYQNTTYPGQENVSARLDYNLPIAPGIQFMIGAKGAASELTNGDYFRYNEQQLSGYSELIHKSSKFDINIGLRYEMSMAELKNEFTTKNHYFLPTFSIGYRHNSMHSVRFTYKKAVTYPSLYQLNPYLNYLDPYSLSAGNATITPSTIKNIELQHSMRIKKGFVNTRLFYYIRENAIDNLLTVNNDGVFVCQPYNLGNINQIGLSGSGTITIGKSLTINPQISLYRFETNANRFAKQNFINSRSGFGLNSSLSALASLGKGLSVSGIVQYYTPVANIQNNKFEDATYFLSIDKEFNMGLKVGVVSAIPFTRNFTYFGEKSSNQEFNSTYSGQIEKSLVPFWFRVTYQFASGKRNTRINRTLEEVETIPRKGF